MKYEQSVRQSKLLIYQMTRVTKERGCLRHDDRLDALAIGVAYYTEQMARDEQQGIDEHKAELLDKELNAFMDNALGRSSKASNNWIGRYT